MFIIFFMIVLPIIHGTSVVSYNQPKFCPNASWDPKAITFADNSLDHFEVYDIFIDTNNTVYTANSHSGELWIWPQGNKNEKKKPLRNMWSAYSLFVTIDGTVYVNSNEKKWGQVDKLIPNTTTRINVMSFSSSCYSLFVDVYNNLYCSLSDENKVVKKSFDDAQQLHTVAGKGYAGSGEYTLSSPTGIFVDVNLNLYVADFENGRIQLFKNGSQAGVTKVGRGARNTFNLHHPIGVVLDGDEHLFIVDHPEDRIIGSNAYGYRCLIGCYAASWPLEMPSVLRFDSDGNIFVIDNDYTQIKKFNLISNSCNRTTSASPSSTTTTKLSTSSSSTSSLSSSTTSSTTTTTTTTTTTSSSTATVSTITTEETTTVYSTEFMTTSDPATLYATTSSSNVLTNFCEDIKPCQNNGTCVSTNETFYGYICHCPPTHNGTYCEKDIRLCKPNTCLNNGICNETSATTFVCKCLFGWTGKRCQDKVDYCKNVRCLNGGSCISLRQNFTCVCPSPSYSGRHCEKQATRIIVLQIVSKSFAYIAILFLVALMLFIVTLDVLKYVFGIDVTQRELEEIRRERRLNVSSRRRRTNARST